jgi:hypothetical protein
MRVSLFVGKQDLVNCMKYFSASNLSGFLAPRELNCMKYFSASNLRGLLALRELKFTWLFGTLVLLKKD